MKKYLTCSFAAAIGFTGLSQSSINSSCGNSVNNYNSLDYSIGQVFYQSRTTNNSLIEHGVQHAYRISTTLVNEDEINLSLSVYPNPVEDKLILKIDNIEKSFSYRLVSMEGKVIQEAPILAIESEIIVKDLPVATYFVEVQHGNQIVQSFKVIKD